MRKATYRGCNIPIPSMATWNLHGGLFNRCQRGSGEAQTEGIRLRVNL